MAGAGTQRISTRIGIREINWRLLTLSSTFVSLEERLEEYGTQQLAEKRGIVPVAVHVFSFSKQQWPTGWLTATSWRGNPE